MEICLKCSTTLGNKSQDQIAKIISSDQELFESQLKLFLARKVNSELLRKIVIIVFV
jgi:hypothetical protein